MIFAVFVPLLFLAVFLAAAVRRVKVYDSFASGAAGVLPLLKSLFPYIAAVLVLAELFEESGLSSLLAEALSPAFGALGIPKEIARLVLIKPFSGSGALSVVSELFSEYGADSYIGRCASVVYASGETVFYMSAVYFAGQKKKTPALPVVIALASNFVAVIFGCLLCRILRKRLKNVNCLHICRNMPKKGEKV